MYSQNKEALKEEFTELSDDYYNSIRQIHGEQILRLVSAAITCKLHMNNIKNASEALIIGGTVLSLGNVPQKLSEVGQGIYDECDRSCATLYTAVVSAVMPDITEEQMEMVDKLADDYCNKIFEWKRHKKAAGAQF
jgi:hypothetical protein